VQKYYFFIKNQYQKSISKINIKNQLQQLKPNSRSICKRGFVKIFELTRNDMKQKNESSETDLTNALKQF
jgi:hypothetical protein